MAFLDEAGLEALWDDIVEFVGEEAVPDDGSITTGKLADGAVTDAKLAQSGGVLEKVDDLESAVNTKAPAIIETASGAIASFDDGADDMPVKKLVANIEPVQDLHGYDSPWPAGGGKNKLNYATATATNTTIRFQNILLKGGTTYTISYYGATNIRIIIYDNATGTTIATSSYTKTYQFSPTNDVVVDISFYDSEGITSAENLFQAEAGTQSTPFAPYSNICPISGWTGAEINGTGINIWDEEWELGVYDIHTGAKVNNTSNIRSKNLISVKPNTRYCWVNNITTTVRIVYYDVNKAYLSIVATSWTSPFVFTTPAKACYMAFYFGGTEYTSCFSINYPATDTDYHPYDGNQISVTFPSEAGTVYGGTLTLNPDRTGTLMVDRADEAMTPDRAVGTIQESTFYRVVFALTNSAIRTSENLTNYYKSYIGGWTDIPDNTFQIIGTSFSIRNDQLDTIEKWRAWLNNHELHVCYKLQNLVEYQLTETEISGILETLYGTNNIWADTGDVEVTYPADTKLYIDNKITQAIANALNS